MLGRSSALAVVGLALCAVASPSGRTRAASDAAGHDALEATRNRPLFSPTRRPPPRPEADEPAGPVAAVPPPSPPPNLQVSGIIVGGDRRVAIVTHPQDPVAIRVAVGSQIDGWTVSAIEERAIVLRREARSVTVAMPEPGR